MAMLGETARTLTARVAARELGLAKPAMQLLAGSQLQKRLHCDLQTDVFTKRSPSPFCRAQPMRRLYSVSAYTVEQEPQLVANEKDAECEDGVGARAAEVVSSSMDESAYETWRIE